MNSPNGRPVLLLSSDLMFTSRATAAARDAGANLTVVSSPAATVEQANQLENALVLVDLTLPGLDINALAQLLIDNAAATELIAYGPHVQAGRLEAARAAGCTVLTRGQFDAQMGTILDEAASA
jgi:CheY-like chemotaxis protein